MLFFFLVSQAFAKIWYKNFDMVKGENYTFSVPQPWVADLYLLFHSFANTNIKITYLTRREYKPAFTLYYSSENMTSTFFKFQLLFPKIEITALADTNIVFGVFEVEDCYRTIGCNDAFDETFSENYDSSNYLSTLKYCLFGVYKETTWVYFKTNCIRNSCSAYSYTNSDGETSSDSSVSDSTESFGGLGFLLTFNGLSSTNKYDTVQVKSSGGTGTPTISHSDIFSVTSYRNDPYLTTNQPIDITTSTEENSTSGTTGANDFFESSNLIIIAVVGGIIICAAIILFSVLLKKRRDSKEKESSS